MSTLTEALPALEALADVMQGLASPEQNRAAPGPAPATGQVADGSF